MVLALVFFCQAMLASSRLSLTFDEPTFIAAGYTRLVLNSFRLVPEAPPLLLELAAAPLLLVDIELPPADDPDWVAGHPIPYARRLLYSGGTDIRTIAAWARLPTHVIGAGLVLVVFFWGRRLYGDIPALVPTTAVAFSPNLLAHAGLATTDLGCSAFMFAAMWVFWRACNSGRNRDWAIAGLVTGLALLTKFTALLIGPAFLIVASVLFLGRDPRGRPKKLILGLTILGAVCVVVIGAGYNLSFDLRHFVRGVTEIYSHGKAGYQWYLFGKISEEPWWYYYLAAYLVKTPLPILGLMGLVAYRLPRIPSRFDTVWFVGVPALLVFLSSCFDQANLGLRRVLPALPFLLLSTGALAVGARRSRIIVVSVLLGWLAIETMLIHPNYLSYFNLAVGGADHGPYLLDDSNVDWGQNLPQLAAWQRANPDSEPIRLLYTGTADPSAYGVHSIPMEPHEARQPLPGKTYAISAHTLVWFRKLGARRGVDIDWLTRYRPVAKAGHSIYIYRFP